MGKHHTRKVNPALKAWVAFVKKVQKEEKCSYPEAMKKAKIRKDKGAKWRGGCGNSSSSLTPAKISGGTDADVDADENDTKTTNENVGQDDKNKNEKTTTGGWRATKRRKSRGGKKSKRRHHKRRGH